jgi:hypothetical protein
VRPRARRDDVVLRELPGELVVYDRREHRAHCLNDTAARVYRAADGTRGVAELAAALGFPGERSQGEALVRLAVEQLASAGLLEAGHGAPEADGTRRELLRRAAVGAGLLLPAVLSLLAPTPADAASCDVGTCAAIGDIGRTCPCASGTCGVCSDTLVCIDPTSGNVACN